MQEKICGRQLFFILSLMRITVVIAFLPVLTTADALQDAWLSAILSFILSSLLVFLIARLGMSYPSETIIDYSRNLLGKKIGSLICLAILWVFLFMSAGDLRIYAEVIITGFLTKTPLVVVLLVLVSVPAMAAFGGIEVIARASEVLFPFFALMVLASLLVAVPTVRFDYVNLQPVFARGLSPILRGAIVPTAIIAQYLVLTVLIPHLQKPKNAFKIALGALGLSSCILVLFAVMVVIVLGPEAGSRQMFPVFAMVRNLRISTFLERFEVLTIFGWGFGLFVGLSVFMYCIAKCLGDLLSLTSYRPLIGPIAMLWLGLSCHEFCSIIDLTEVFQPNVLGPFVASWFLLIIMPLWLVHLVKSRKKEKNDELS